MTDTPEVTPVRSSSPELSAMTLPKLKEVATQLGIDGAAKLKKDALVTAIADLQAANREAAKAEREARREARNAKKRGNKDNSTANSSDSDGDDEGDDNSSSNSND
ncbi:MAG: transcription termination factor Rho, partial [Actinobacteria bacterium]|nr:transcription termination factor Rho [Actinomycetota bacterium]